MLKNRSVISHFCADISIVNRLLSFLLAIANFAAAWRRHVVVQLSQCFEKVSALRQNSFKRVTWRIFIFTEMFRLLFSSRVEILDRGQLLQIHESRPFDTSRYRCVASNAAGDDTKSFDVEVQGAMSRSFHWNTFQVIVCFVKYSPDHHAYFC